MATSPLPSQGPTSGRKCYVTPAFLAAHNKGDKIRNAYLTPTFSRAHKRAEALCNPCILGRPPNKGTKPEVPTSPLPSQGPTSGRKCYVTPAFSVVPRQGNKIRSGWLTPIFSGAHKRAEVLRNPCILADPQTKGTKSEVAASPVPSRGLTRGQKCYVTPAFSGVPSKRGQNQKWLPHPYLLGGPQVGTSATQPLHSRGSPRKGTKSQVLGSPLPSRGPTRGQKCYKTPTFLGGPQQRGQNQKWLPHPCLLGASQEDESAM